MTSRAKARAARMQALLNDDGTVTPAAQLPTQFPVPANRLEAEALALSDTLDSDTLSHVLETSK